MRGGVFLSWFDVLVGEERERSRSHLDGVWFAWPLAWLCVWHGKVASFCFSVEHVAIVSGL